MRTFDKITPAGTRDRMFGECGLRRRLSEKLGRLYSLRGFDEVSTPVLEYYDVFDTARVYFPQENMLKLVDRSGRLLVLRPDCTIPIARLISTRLQAKTGPIRLFYHQNVYRYADGNGAASGEIDQMGVESVGAGGLISDVEMVELAARSLKTAGATDFQIELCPIGYFKALIDSLGVGEEEKERVRELIERKNFPALGSFLDRLAPTAASAALRRLPALFGTREVIDEARSLFRNEAADQALDDLERLYDALGELGLSEHVTLDLGLVNQADYYTGIIFRGYLGGAGEAVLSGGRYDGLLGEFGAPRPATGFGVNLDLLCESLGGEGAAEEAAELLVAGDGCRIGEVFAYLEERNRTGVRVELIGAGNELPERRDARILLADENGIRETEAAR